MSTATTLQINSTSSEQTEKLAEQLGKRLRGGEVIELVSDLGGGKTTFTRGLARGAGSSDQVASPTFMLSREYGVADHAYHTIAHFDFYRLGEAGIVADELAEVIGNPQYVTVVEWGDIVHDVLPENRLSVQIAQTGEDTRQLTFAYPPGLAYLVEGLQ
jgi:tRNA threonylcarbamoyladenosine biosynthesis protein TsaE